MRAVFVIDEAGTRAWRTTVARNSLTHITPAADFERALEEARYRAWAALMKAGTSISSGAAGTRLRGSAGRTHRRSRPRMPLKSLFLKLVAPEGRKSNPLVDWLVRLATLEGALAAAS
jgi:hypothetical protein